MEFTLKGPFRENIYNLLREIGYHFLKKDEEKSEYNFIRLIGSNAYPRFHLYIKTENKNFIFNLHLDQKRPIYKGVPAHSGEYDGEVIEKEAERIKEAISKGN